MLKLTKKEGEQTLITTPSGEEIIIENLGKGRVVIQAPPNCAISREGGLVKESSTDKLITIMLLVTVISLTIAITLIRSVG